MGEREFVDSIAELKAAEAEKETILGEMGKKCDSLLKIANEQSKKIAAETDNEATALKNKLLEEARREISLEEEKVLGQAKDQADMLKGLELNRSALNRIVSTVLKE